MKHAIKSVTGRYSKYRILWLAACDKYLILWLFSRFPIPNAILLHKNYRPVTMTYRPVTLFFNWSNRVYPRKWNHFARFWRPFQHWPRPVRVKMETDTPKNRKHYDASASESGPNKRGNPPSHPRPVSPSFFSMRHVSSQSRRVASFPSHSHRFASLAFELEII